MARDRNSKRSSRKSSSGSSRRTYKRRSAEAVKQRASQKANNFDSHINDGFEEFKPDVGEHDVRILPPTWENAEHCGLDIFLHYNIGTNGSTYLCPKEMNDEPCPICEERDQALADGDSDYATKLKPGKRVLHWIIDRDNEKDGVKFWSMPWTFDRDVAVLSYDKKTGEVLPYDDPEEGYDIGFSRTGTGLKTKYIGIKIARSESDLGRKSDDWLDYIDETPLPAILHFYDYDHLKTAIEGGVKEYEDKDSKDEKDDDNEDKSSKRKGRGRSRKPSYDWDSVHGLGPDELDDLVDGEGLDISPNDFDSEEEYADEICNVMEINEEKDEDQSSNLRRKVNRNRSRR